MNKKNKVYCEHCFYYRCESTLSCANKNHGLIFSSAIYSPRYVGSFSKISNKNNNCKYYKNLTEMNNKYEEEYQTLSLFKRLFLSRDEFIMKKYFDDSYRDKDYIQPEY